jgi:O-antigen/teichoic acid export membrane protein
MVLQKSFDLLAILAIPLVIGTQLVAEEVMVLVAGSEFSASGPILRILIIAAAMIFFGNIPAHAIIAINKQKKIIGAYIFTAITAVVGYYIFIPRFSYFGAAWITIYSELAIALASIYLVWRHTRFIPNLKVFFKALAASLAMAVSIYALYFSGINNLIFVVSLAAIVYFVFLYLFKGLSKTDILSLFNR